MQAVTEKVSRIHPEDKSVSGFRSAFTNFQKHEEKRAFDIIESHFLVLSDTRKMHALEVSACLIEYASFSLQYASFWLLAYVSSVLAVSKVKAILLSMDALMLLCSV